MSTWTFSPLQRVDFPLLARWLSAPHVWRWWHAQFSPDALEEQYGGSIDGTDACNVFVAHYEGAALGLIQIYRIADYPAYVEELASVFAVSRTAFGIDYLVGPPDALGRGNGSAMIMAFVDAAFRRYPDCASIVVPVHAENLRSHSALRRAGFVEVARGDLTPDYPGDSRDHRIFRCLRPIVTSR